MSKQNQWIVGVNAVASSIEKDPENVREVLIEAGAKNPRLVEIEEEALRKGIDVRKVNAQALGGVAGQVRHQGVVARYAAPKLWDENELKGLIEAAEGKALVLVLDEVQDPHNLGACLRSADAMGVHAVVAPKDRAVGITPVVEKVASGAVETVPYLMVTNLARTLEMLQERHIFVVGLAGEGEADLPTLDLSGALTLVLGAEGAGLRRLTRERCDTLARIPMFGAVESLNVSVATGVCLYEARRQRGLAPLAPRERGRG